MHLFDLQFLVRTAMHVCFAITGGLVELARVWILGELGTSLD
jgi:hypothetical protein